ncbi:class I SAM-dependent methyltransferase [Bacillus horti]|uniref:Ubiquinone/menaquinone biosynthesis C-methylase UbiE n=1 Tax=Caldalkalibacillus horti TaxID=77523 RepID=A0ABT9VVE7_9BACI|nr:class I SAM-dependent methyltransferase [Bacillus horti]MDQ0164956.1 ubiquinone/menaquinone biosynthesis C-methylase UbiE [Bacillus horti]
MNDKLQRKINNLQNIDRLPFDELVEFFPLNDRDQVLDLGAGAGYTSLSIANQVDRVCAFDFDQDILEYLGTVAKEQAINNIEAVAGDFRDMPLEDKRFDKAIASISLHEASPLESALKEINRVLKDKGLFLCIELEKNDTIHAPRVPFAEMKATLLQSGFSIVDTIFPETKVANQAIYIIIAQKN